MSTDQILGKRPPPRSYTAEELERETKFDRRTIAYYVQEGLLPKVGRRGPRTRYPKLTRDRLLFIRRVREMEVAGDVPPVSLSSMREIFNRVPPEEIAQVADGHTPLRIVALATAGASLSADSGTVKEPYAFAAWKEESMEAAELDDSASSLRRMAASRSEGSMEEKELGDALADLQDAVRHRRQIPSRSIDSWSQVEISPEIMLSVRGASDEDAELLESVRRKLRGLISRRSKRH